ncbi:MAG: 3-dehydroquinate synthase [Clostridia bacterium]|nr:3-dehydroquinate synthase [Clostridia bacterium]
MKTLHVDLGEHAYNIHIAGGLLDRAGEYCRAALPRAKRLAVVSDNTVAGLYARRLLGSLWGAGFEASLVTVPAGETSKSLTKLGDLYDAFMDMGLTRSDAVVALGGGVVGDLAGFAAATILRGVSFVQIPTTLLAQVDSSVGGKVAIDLSAGKNLAGAFWQPKLVLMDPECLDTLDDKTFSDGMAEVVKYGCIQDKAFFERLEAAPGRAAVREKIESILYTCCDLKRIVVEKDERDTGERMILNFGHTLGHAYEKAGEYRLWTHGQAVAAGMGIAADLGVRLGVTAEEVPGRIRALAAAFGLPTDIACDMIGYASAIGLDKKGAGDDITLVLLKDLGQAVLKRLPKKDVLTMLEDYAE